MEGIKTEGYDEWHRKGQTATEILQEAEALIGTQHQEEVVDITINGREYRGTLSQIQELIEGVYKQ